MNILVALLAASPAHKGLTYTVFERPGVLYRDAALLCKQAKARLAEPRTEDALNIVRKLVAKIESRPSAWIGAERCKPGRFCWRSGGALKFRYDHAHWVRNAMNIDTPKAGLALQADGKFVTGKADAFVCERPSKKPSKKGRKAESPRTEKPARSAKRSR